MKFLPHQFSYLFDVLNISASQGSSSIKFDLICKILDKSFPKLNGVSYSKQISFVKDRKSHDYRYAINSNKLRQKMNWKPKITFEKGLNKTIEFYLKKLKSL